MRCASRCGRSAPAVGRRTRPRKPAHRHRHARPAAGGYGDRGQCAGPRRRMRDPPAAAWVQHVWADGGYAGRLVAIASRPWAITGQIVHLPTGQRGFAVPPRRWVVERTPGLDDAPAQARPRLRTAAGDPRGDHEVGDGRAHAQPARTTAGARNRGPASENDHFQTPTTKGREPCGEGVRSAANAAK
jgi:hypothetical protein